MNETSNLSEIALLCMPITALGQHSPLFDCRNTARPIGIVVRWRRLGLPPKTAVDRATDIIGNVDTQSGIQTPLAL